MNRITLFRKEYRFLSNSYQCSFEFKGVVYPNAESVFQAQKCSTDDERIKYTLQKNPVCAKQMGKKEPGLPRNWDEISPDIMREILIEKFSLSHLVKMLKSTGDAYIEESNHWHDNR